MKKFERTILSKNGNWYVIVVEGEDKLMIPCGSREECIKTIKSWGMNPAVFQVKVMK